MHLKKNYNDFKENWGTGMDDKEKIERALRFLKKFEGYADSLATTTVILSNAMPSFKRYFQNIKKTLED